jgi:hypothetical protein
VGGGVGARVHILLGLGLGLGLDEGQPVQSRPEAVVARDRPMRRDVAAAGAREAWA